MVCAASLPEPEIEFIEAAGRDDGSTPGVRTRGGGQAGEIVAAIVSIGNKAHEVAVRRMRARHCVI